MIRGVYADQAESKPPESADIQGVPKSLETLPTLAKPGFASLSDHEQAAQYLTTLYAPYAEGYVEGRAFRSGQGGRVVQEWFSVQQILDTPSRLTTWAFAQTAQGRDVYVGALPRCEAGKGSKEAVMTAGVIWAELDDVKIEGGRETIRHMLEEAQADIVVASGGGLHAYWLLDKVIEFDSDSKLAFERYVRWHQEQMGGDLVADCSRILRLPGTINYKYEGKPKVELLKCP